MTTISRRREGRRIRRREQGKPYTQTFNVYPVLDGRFFYVQIEGKPYLVGEYKPRAPRQPIIHNGRKPR